METVVGTVAGTALTPEVAIDPAIATSLLRAALKRSAGVRESAIALTVFIFALALALPVLALLLIPCGAWMAALKPKYQAARAAWARLANEDVSITLSGDRLLLRDRSGQAEYRMSAGEQRALRALPAARVVTPR